MYQSLGMFLYCKITYFIIEFSNHSSKVSNALLDGLEFPIGKIYPGEVISRKISIKYSAGMMDEVEPVEINLFDQKKPKYKWFYWYSVLCWK